MSNQRGTNNHQVYMMKEISNDEIDQQSLVPPMRAKSHERGNTRHVDRSSSSDDQIGSWFYIKVDKIFEKTKKSRLRSRRRL